MRAIKILHLYPNEMSLYGDNGNAKVLQKRLEWRGYSVEVTYHHSGAKLKHAADIIVGGGGQDSSQIFIAKDLERIASQLRAFAEEGVPMLAVCGMYQLFGNQMVTSTGVVLPGVSIFNCTTIASSKRMVGNISVRTDLGLMSGFENHSGETNLLDGQKPFGIVEHGHGNGTEKHYEGAVTNNAYGTYLHGCVLGRNPHFADHLLATALLRIGVTEPLKVLSNPLLDSPSHH